MCANLPLALDCFAGASPYSCLLAVLLVSVMFLGITQVMLPQANKLASTSRRVRGLLHETPELWVFAIRHSYLQQTRVHRREDEIGIQRRGRPNI